MDIVSKDNQLMLLCSFRSETAVKRVFDKMMYSDLLSFILGRWSKASRESISISYRLPGHDNCMLDSEEDFINMRYIAKSFNMDRVDIDIIDLDGDCDEESREDNDSETVMVENKGMESEIDLLPSFCANQEKLLLDSAWSREIREVGQKFEGGAKEFRKALCKYSIAIGFRFKYLKNDKERVTVVCSFSDEKGCAWRIHASRQPINGFFYIRNMNNEHTCGLVMRSSKHPRVSSDLVTSLIMDKVRTKPLTQPIEVVGDIKKDYGLDIMYHHAWLGVENAKKEIFGDHSLSFDKLKSYFREAERCNPGSHLILDIHPETRRFERCFVSFAAFIQGLNWIKPVIFLNQTFLKGRYKGVLLGATCKDGNTGVFSLAYAVVSSEDTNNWTWFLEELRKILDPNRKITFISDRNTGLIEGVKTIFPDHFHGYCLFNLKFNLRDKFRGVGGNFGERIVDKFNLCAYAPDPEKFHKELDSLLVEGGQRVKDFLRDLPHEKWAHAYFKGRRYGEMCSNITDSWNSKILEVKYLPITSMIDEIRLDSMKVMAERRSDCKKWTGVLCPAMETKLQAALDEGRTWNISSSNEDIFEVHCHPSVFVDIKLRVCSCGQWQNNCFPCSHAAVVLLKSSLVTQKAITDYIEPYFYVEYYEKCYSGSIHPVSTSSTCNDPVVDGVILPPVEKKVPGGPKGKRIPSRGEKVREIRCGRCGKKARHNRKTCKDVIA